MKKNSQLESATAEIARREYILTPLQAKRIERLAHQLDKTEREVFDMMLDDAVVTIDSLMAANCIIGPCPIEDDDAEVITGALDAMSLDDIIAREDAHESEYYEPLQRIIALELGRD